MSINNKTSVLGIIPARGGSKGVLRKNIRSVAGKPLIAYTIRAAQASSLLSCFVTSTDDPEIAACAEQLGSPVLLRPAELAGDTTPMVPVIKHMLSCLRLPEGLPDYLVLLQPTAPLRTSADIDAAVSLLLRTQADTVISVYQVADHHPARMYLMSPGGRLEPYAQEPAGMLRQELQPVYHRNGAIYACRRTLVEQRNTLLGPDMRAYVMPRERSVNIDDEVDLSFASFLLSRERPAA